MPSCLVSPSHCWKKRENVNQAKKTSLFTNNDTTITICITNIIMTTIILSTFTLYLPIRPLLHPLPFPTARIEPLAVCRFSRNTRWPVAVGEPFHEAQPKSSVNNSVFLLSRQNDDALKFNQPWMPHLNYENPLGHVSHCKMQIWNRFKWHLVLYMTVGEPLFNTAWAKLEMSYYNYQRREPFWLWLSGFLPFISADIFPDRGCP